MYTYMCICIRFKNADGREGARRRNDEEGFRCNPVRPLMGSRGVLMTATVDPAVN